MRRPTPLERHVARTLGLRPAEARALLAGARRRLGARGYALRAGAFSAATAPGLRRLVPAGARAAWVRPLVRHMIMWPDENLVYLGLRAPGAAPGCDGLVDG